MLQFKQIIVLPNKVVNSVFNLPCIRGIEKMPYDDNEIVYRLKEKIRSPRGVVAHSLRPGDIIGEDMGGRWWWLREKDHQMAAQGVGVPAPYFEMVPAR